MTTREEVLTVGEVARILRFEDERSVYALLSSGQLVGFRTTPNGPWRIRRRALDDFIESSEKESARKSLRDQNAAL